MPPAGDSGVMVSGFAGGLPDHVVRVTVRQVLQRDRRVVQIGVTFVGKRRMQELNARYLRHDRPTDVLSFPLPQPDGSLAGDVYVCRYVAARQARAHHTTVREELRRLIVHGTLHVLGWDHPDGAARTRSPMWRRQEQHVASSR